jgi:hypothetical protein
MKRVLRTDGNLACLYSALNYNLGKSGNFLSIWARNGCSVKVVHEKDLFGYCGRWDANLERAFQSGATRVFSFDRHDYEGFSDYLLFNAFRSDWKGILPYHYKLDVKDYLKKLFQNASEHCNDECPIFISSSYKDGMLRFTMVDCGQGFLNRIKILNEDVVSESQAISWALNGNSVKGDDRSCTLRSLGQYCSENGGELLIVSGGASVLYCRHGFHQHSLLPGPFGGAIINFSVKIKVMEFEQRCAA